MGRDTLHQWYTGQYSNMDEFGLMFYVARWYDPVLGRFAQADTVVPDGVQGYDRYAYANNSPVVYSDPSGHCVNGDIECRDELRETEKKYHVAVNDKGGHWTVKGLNAIARGMEKLKSRMGNAHFEDLFSGVTFSVGGKPNGMGTTGHRDVLVGSNEMNDQNYVERNTVHELAHIWDNTCHDCMSKGMEAVDGSYYQTMYRAGVVSVRQWVSVGRAPTTYARDAGREEDWAESVKAFLYPSENTLRMDSNRAAWVENAVDILRY